MIKKIVKSKITWLLLALAIIGLCFIFITDYSSGREPQWGVTFSIKYAEELKLDWREAYIAMLDDAKVRNIRIPVYWDDLEAVNNVYNFDDIDWMLDQAEQRDARVVLAIGRRTPRWPECHDPLWLGGLTDAQVSSQVLEMLTTVVTRYQDNSEIMMWQVENEPTLSVFGNCPPLNEGFLAQEIALVEKLDPIRPVMVTDSGELSTWRKVSKFGDVLGTSVYRVVWNEYTGTLKYFFIPPAYYRFKADHIDDRRSNITDIVISELQMEPWTFGKSMIDMTGVEQEKTFNLKQFKSNLVFARKTGFSEVYLWGVEYWYWQKTVGNDSYWLEAKKLWQ